MKRNYVAIVAVAALALTSCVQEVPENGKEEIVISENALAFSIQGTAKTRSVEADEPLSVTHLRLGAPIDGEQYYLEETLTLLDGVPAETPATRGTPAYTSNIASPATAKAQKDILFAGRPVTKADFAPVAPVLFHHALTGVKFATANHQSGKDGGTKTVITKIEFVGLKTTGTCTITPTSENEVYKDDPKTTPLQLPYNGVTETLSKDRRSRKPSRLRITTVPIFIVPTMTTRTVVPTTITSLTHFMPKTKLSKHRLV